MTRLLLALMTFVLLAAACADDSADVDGDGDADVGQPDDSGPTGEWLLTDSSSVTGPVPLVDGYDITLSFRKGEVGGRAACNSYFGTIQTISDGQWSVDAYAITEMGCPDPGVLESEQAYLDALGVIDSYEYRDDDLVLLGPDTELSFSLVAPVEDSPLVGITWSLDTLIDGDTASNIAGMDLATIEFAADGTVSGFTGCNQFRADYEIDGSTMFVGALTRTEIACGDPDSHIYAVLGLGELSHSIEADRLTIRTADGGAGLVYRASG